MYLCNVTPETRALYDGFFESRGLNPPFGQDHLILVRDEGRLLGGVSVYLTRGPYMFLEHFTLNPEVSGREAVRVTEFLCKSATAMGTIMGKMPLALVEEGGIESVLERQGYRVLPHRALLAPIGQPPKAASPRDEEVPEARAAPGGEEPRPREEEDGGIMAQVKAKVKARPRRKNAKSTATAGDEPEP